MKKIILTITTFALVAAGCGDGIAFDGPRGADNPPDIGQQIDRVGRAAISTALIAAFESDSTIKGNMKDAYNTATPASSAGFRDAMIGSLAILDSLDEVCGNQLIADANPAERYGALANVLVDDQLYVNSLSGECGVYLGLEAELVGAVDPGVGGCGGRTPDDDIIERSYSVLAAGALSGVDDTITGNDVANSASFPFLASPN